MEERTPFKILYLNDLVYAVPLSPELKKKVQVLKEQFCREIGGHVWMNREKGRWRCFICQKIRKVRKKRRAKIQGIKSVVCILDERMEN